MQIGLTGGMGSGKSTAAQYFAELGVPVIDADEIAHELVIKESPAYTKIIAHFGTDIINEQGDLQRAKLRTLIFNNPVERQWLEDLLHPLILAEMQKRREAIVFPYCILVIPLLLEKKLAAFIDRVLIIDLPESLQIQRIQQRDQAEHVTIDAMLKAQITRNRRLAQADDLIHNDGTLAELRQQVQYLHEFYLQLAST